MSLTRGWLGRFSAHHPIFPSHCHGDKPSKAGGGSMMGFGTWDACAWCLCLVLPPSHPPIPWGQLAALGGESRMGWG